MIGRTFVLLIAVLGALAGSAAGQESFGMPVYPGSQFDEEETSFVEEVLYIEGTVFTTDAPVQQVVEFFEQKGCKRLDTSSSGNKVTLRKGTVEVVVQSPWKDVKTHKKRTDTRIAFLKKEP